MFSTRKTISMVLVSCMVASSGSALAKSSKSCPFTGAVTEESHERFSSVNKLFRKHYAAARKAIEDDFDVVIYGNEGALNLYIDGKKKDSRDIIDGRYTFLKEVAHITLGTYVMLMNKVDKDLDDATVKEVLDFKEAIEKASPDIAKVPLDEKVAVRQKKLVETTTSFLGTVAEQRRVSSAELRAYTRSVAQMDLDNAAEAAAAQLENIDKVVAEWKGGMTDEQWQKLRVIISVGHMPRKQYSIFQYFLRLFNEKEEGERVITVDAGVGYEPGMDLLATHALDRKVAIDFFKDKWRMHRDLLSDGARQYLKKHPPLKQ